MSRAVSPLPFSTGELEGRYSNGYVDSLICKLSLNITTSTISLLIIILVGFIVNMYELRDGFQRMYRTMMSN